jgi:hypothetical protein
MKMKMKKKKLKRKKKGYLDMKAIINMRKIKKQAIKIQLNKKFYKYKMKNYF